MATLRGLSGRRWWPRRRVPVRRQLTRVECGAACLAMVLSYYGRPTKVAECRDRCDVGRDGLSLLAVAHGARSFGMQAKGLAVDPPALRSVPLPAIVHWQGEHFVVVESMSARHVRIVDPASGRKRLTADQFADSFSGTVLSVRPGPDFDTSPHRDPSPWPAYVRGLAGTAGIRRMLAQILLASLLVTGIGLLVPVLTLILVDQIMISRMSGLLSVVVTAAASVALATLVTSNLRLMLLVRLQARLDAQVLPEFFHHLLRLPVKFFQQRSSGDLLMRLASNTAIRDLLSSQTVSVVLDSAMAIIYAIILATMAPAFAVAAVAVAAAHGCLLMLTARRMHHLMQQDLAAQADTQAYAVEALSGITTLKAAGAEDRTFDRWHRYFLRQVGTGMLRHRLGAVIDMYSTTLRTTTPLILLLVGSLYVLEGQLSLGAMLALVSVASSFLVPLSSLIATGQQLQIVGAQLERIGDVLQAPAEQDDDAVVPAPRLTGRIELRDVSFRYDEAAPWTLRHISLTIQPGQRIAIVGRTGAGKSTLVRLVLGLYECTEGQVYYDEHALSELDRPTLRRQLGAVIQDSFLFNASVRDNIALNRPSAPLDQIVQAAQLAAIHDDVCRMPAGYNTLVAEGGSALSGGQRQRLALARAVAAEPSILVLDEATSHLDAPTEAVVAANLSHLSGTQVVVAHRLSTIRDADLIVVLDDGRIAESGTHAELLQRGGLYAALLEGQLELQDNLAWKGTG